MERLYRIAGLTVRMDTSGRTESQAEKYIVLDAEHVDFEVRSCREAIREKYPEATDDDAEYLSTGANFYYKLLNYDGIMLHSSAVVVDGKAYLFSADSGTGKSTHTNLWLRLFGDRAYILNDDKPALRLVNGTWYAYGTPWSGKNDISANIGVPLAGIAILERGENNEIRPYRGVSAIFDVYRQVNRPTSADYREKILVLLNKLFSDIPVWKLKCNMDLEAALVAYKVMSEKEFAIK